MSNLRDRVVAAVTSRRINIASAASEAAEHAAF
jgi:hypothetical protein